MEEVKKMKEKGLYYNPKGDFKSNQQIKRKFALDGELPILETPFPDRKNWNYWSKRFIARQEQYIESSQLIEKQHVEISFKGDTVINFMGDQHIGGAAVNYNRIEQEVETIINTPSSFVIMVGDTIDGFFFNPAQMEQVEQTPEQWKYVKSLLEYLSENDKLLIGFGGDHDGWPKKMGIDPYATFAEDLGAYYMQGVGHLTAKVNGQEYKMTGAHRLPGFSMYNNVHPQMRASKEIQGADVYYSAHTHIKGYSFQAIKEFGGTARKVNFISLGPYKSSDEYSRKKGWAVQSPQEMFGSAIILRSDNAQIDYYDDILEANRLDKLK